MDLQELNDLLRAGESDPVEFKKTTGQLREGRRNVCAMLNGVGGFALFGITPAGWIDGRTLLPRRARTCKNMQSTCATAKIWKFPNMSANHIAAHRRATTC
jgi:predicted HTH transcriptional regulator